MAFPSTQLDLKVEVAWGADLSAASSTWAWTNVTSDVLADRGVSVTRGRSDGNGGSEPSRVEFTLDDRTHAYTPTNPTGSNYPYVRQGTPIRVSVNNGAGYVTRATVFADSWTPQWDPKYKAPVSIVRASGLLRRLSKGAEVPTSTIKEWHLQDPQPIAYWPCEDQTGATQLASAIDGAPPMFFSGDAPTLHSDGPDGSDSLPSLGAGTYLDGQVATYAKANSWTVMAIVRVASAVPVDTPVINMLADGTVVQWRIALYPNGGSTDQCSVEGWNSAGTAVIVDPVTFTAGSLTEPYNRFLLFTLSATQNGSNVDYTQVTYDCTTGGSTSNTGSVAGTIGNIRRVQVLAGWDHSSWIFGHFAVYNYSLTPPTDILNGLLGQTAADRITDTCTNHDVPFLLVGTASDTATMGPRPISGIVSILEECEAADGGILYDGFSPQLEYRTRYDRYNLAATMTLNMSSAQVSQPFEPMFDDQQFRNDWTVTRSGGSSGRDLDQDHIDAHGRYNDTTTLNVEDDTGLVDQAGWRVNLGTVDELRYPNMQMNLARSPSIINTWMTVDVGDRVSVSNPPTGHPPDAIDVIVDGYTERLFPKNWLVTLNCSPYRPWDVFTVEDTLLGRLDTGGSELNADFSTSFATLKVATTDPLDNSGWDSTATPFDIEVGGERMTVTSVTTPSKSYIGAGAGASGNNATLNPALPASVQGGDLLLLFAAIRSSGSGTPNTPTGWELVLSMSNACLFAKQADGAVGSGTTEATPSVSFSGGSAGDDTLAQVAAWRSVNSTVAFSDSQLNSSAQNIAYPSLDIIGLDNCLVVYLGWKQDDWTSVATLGGATEIGEVSSTAGNDSAIVWDYVQQTTATNIASGSFTVTGGASAISRGGVVAFRGLVQSLAVTRSVNGVVKAQTAGTPVTLWRPGVTAL